MKTLNFTIKIEEKQLNQLDNWLRAHFQVLDYRILPDTERLYQEDENFQKLVKAEKAAKRIKEKYINEHNHPKSATH